MRYEDITIDWLRENVQHIHYFGLGFIQAKLTQNTRLHFYTDNLPKTCNKEEVHNHRYNFLSTVLTGRFEQQIFEYKYNDDGLFVMTNESCVPDVDAPGLKMCADIIHVGDLIHVAGDSYYMHTDTFHTVSAIPGTITYLKRGDVLKAHATVIRDKHAIPVCPFSQNIPVNELYDIVETILYK